MGLFDFIPSSAWTMRLIRALELQLGGIDVRDLSDMHKQWITTAASQYRKTSMTAEEVAEIYVKGVLNGGSFKYYHLADHHVRSIDQISKRTGVPVEEAAEQYIADLKSVRRKS